MSDGFAFFDNVFIAMVAAFLILRLRSVLGRRTGEENPDRWTTRPSRPATPGTVERTSDNVVQLPRSETPDGGKTAPGVPATPLDAALTQIKLADPNFEPRAFVAGARGAFEMIVGAFAHGDTATLRPLLADDVYANFAAAIGARQQAKHTLETTLISIKSADIVEARIDGRTAMVTVKFVSEQANVTRDAGGTVIEGEPNTLATITDVWTFSRNTRARDPNWLLSATAESH